MLNVICTIRDYNPGGDTCSVEIQGAGVIDAWVDGVRVAPTVPRAYLVYGAQGVLSMPDIHRLCEATLTQIVPPSGLVTVSSPATVQRTETGRGIMATNASGNATSTVSFSSAFSAAPLVSLLADDLTAITITGITTSSFTVSLGSAYRPNAYIRFSWSATGE